MVWLGRSASQVLLDVETSWNLDDKPKTANLPQVRSARGRCLQINQVGELASWLVTTHYREMLLRLKTNTVRPLICTAQAKCLTHHAGKNQRRIRFCQCADDKCRLWMVLVMVVGSRHNESHVAQHAKFWFHERCRGTGRADSIEIEPTSQHGNDSVAREQQQ